MFAPEPSPIVEGPSPGGDHAPGPAEPTPAAEPTAAATAPEPGGFLVPPDIARALVGFHYYGAAWIDPDARAWGYVDPSAKEQERARAFLDELGALARRHQVRLDGEEDGMTVRYRGRIVLSWITRDRRGRYRGEPVRRRRPFGAKTRRRDGDGQA